MGRLILLAIVIGIVVLAITSVMVAINRLTTPQRSLTTRSDAMPKSFRTVSYVMLILLLLGLSTGLIGGL